MPKLSNQSKAVPTYKKIRLHFGYFIITIMLFITEIIIAKYVTGWVRAYLGDVIVVILIYTAIMTVFNFNKRMVIIGTLMFSFFIEVSQYFKLAEVLGFERGSIAYIALGNTFSIEDLICYTVGCMVIWGMESWLNRA